MAWHILELDFVVFQHRLQPFCTNQNGMRHGASFWLPTLSEAKVKTLVVQVTGHLSKDGVMSWQAIPTQVTNLFGEPPREEATEPLGLRGS